MKKKTNIFLIVAVLLFFSLVSCERGFDIINKDPNGVTDVPSDFLLPGAIMSLSNADNSFMESFAYASNWVQHISCGFWTDPERYNFEKSRSFLWDNLYTGPLNDLKVMNRKAIEEGNRSLQAVSLVLYSYGFSLLTDCFGPLPYTEALSAEEGLNKPGYDSEELVYLALLDSLVIANNIFKEVTRISISPGYDVLFAADLSKWQKFTNGLRLRIMIRISEKLDMRDRLRSLVTDPESPLPSSNADNALFSYSAASTRTWHPLYDVLSAEASDGGYRISKTLADQMISTADPRLAVYALKNATDAYAGLPTGAGSGSGQIDNYSRINPRFGQKDRNGVFMTFSEVNFLLAEAAARKLIDGEAQTWYDDAILSNFQELGLVQAEFDAFIQSPAGRYTNVDRIALQKWVALFGRGLEAWTEYRRTGIPALQPAAYALELSVPSRFLYPLSEEQTNKENLQEASQLLSKGDALTSPLWWMK